MFGTYALSSGYYDQYYNKAQQVRTVIIDDFNKAFEKVDVIIAPTSPSLALPVGATKDASMFGEIADVLVEPSSCSMKIRYFGCGRSVSERDTFSTAVERQCA